MQMTADDVRVLLLQLKDARLVLNDSYNRLRDMRQALRYDFDTRCLLLVAEGHVDDALDTLRFLEEERSKT